MAHRASTFLFGVVALLSIAVAAPASAQDRGGEVFQGEARAVALELRVLGQGATVGLGSARVNSEPTAVGEGTGVAGIAGTVSRSSGNQDSPEACAANLGGLAVTTSASCAASGDSSASIVGGNPRATGRGTVADLGVNLAPLLGDVTTALTGLVGQVCAATPVPAITVPGVGPITPVVADCTALLTGLTGGLTGQPVTLTVGDSNASVVTDANRVTATGTAQGATVNLINIPDTNSAAQVCEGPLVKLTVGDSRATAVYDRGSTESTSSVDPALATVDLCLITSDPPPVRVAVGQNVTIPGTDITITAASGRTFRGSAGVEANAASISGLGGNLVLRIAGASAIVDGGRPAVSQGAEPFDLPRTGGGMPPWAPVVAAGALTLAVLVRRAVLRTR